MTTECQAKPQFIKEPGKNVPLVYDTDVVVAGAGISGVFAAIAAARKGAQTALTPSSGLEWP